MWLPQGDEPVSSTTQFILATLNNESEPRFKASLKGGVTTSIVYENADSPGQLLPFFWALVGAIIGFILERAWDYINKRPSIRERLASNHFDGRPLKMKKVQVGQDRNLASRLSLVAVLFALFIGILSLPKEVKEALGNNGAWLIVVAQAATVLSPVFFLIYLLSEANQSMFHKNATSNNMDALGKWSYDIGVVLTSTIFLFTLGIWIGIIALIKLNVPASIGTYLYIGWLIILFLLVLFCYSLPSLKEALPWELRGFKLIRKNNI